MMLSGASDVNQIVKLSNILTCLPGPGCNDVTNANTYSLCLNFITHFDKK